MCVFGKRRGKAANEVIAAKGAGFITAAKGEGGGRCRVAGGEGTQAEMNSSANLRITAGFGNKKNVAEIT